VILDLAGFVQAERPYWEELEAITKRLDDNPQASMSLEQVTRFHYLYQRCAADLARIGSLSTRPESFAYLEGLVARAYTELHDNPQRGRFSLLTFVTRTFPQTFRRNVRAFALSLLITVVATGFGAGSLALDYDTKSVFMPFSGLMGSPAERVKREESMKHDRMADVRSTFSAQLMTHNIQVSLFVLALGMTWGVGTIVMLFYNGAILGAVGFDYIHAGYAPFLFGWLLPHGVIEIPAILIAGQASFLLANALIGWGDRTPRSARLRAVSGDVLTLAGGCALMLVWAGIVEAFLSQYHEPVLPYALKIAFGLAELGLLTFYLARAGVATK
jgi:uncharacterized membrane protein SpoIIM required for sporulation